MKRLRFLYLPLIMLAVLIGGCSEKSDYINVIPAHANLVAAIHLNSLVQKAGLDGGENKDLIQQFKTALEGEVSGATAQHLEALLEKPAESGIDWTAPLYLFSAPDFPYISIVAKVNSKKKLSNLLKTLHGEQFCSDIKEGKNYSYVTVNEEGLLAFTNSALLYVDYGSLEQTGAAKQPEQIKQRISLLLKQSEKQSIVTSTSFKKMQGKKGDITMMMSPSGFWEKYARQLNYGIAENVDLKDLVLLGNLSFEKGKISLSYESYTNDPELKRILEQQQKATCLTNGSSLKFFPKSTLALFNIGLNGKKAYEAFKTNSKFGELFYDKEIKELFGMLQQDVTIGVTSVKAGSNIPIFLAYAAITDKAPVKKLYERREELSLIGITINKSGKDDYVLKMPNLTFYLGTRGKHLFVTNDEKLYQTIGQTAIPSVEETAYASILKGKNIAGVINAEALSELPLIKTMSVYGGQEYQSYYTLARKVAYLAITVEGRQSEITLQLQNKNENALKQVVKMIKDFGGF